VADSIRGRSCVYSQDKRRKFNTDILSLVASPLIKEGDMPDRDVTELATFKNLVERHWKAEVSLAG